MYLFLFFLLRHNFLSYDTGIVLCYMPSTPSFDRSSQQYTTNTIHLHTIYKPCYKTMTACLYHLVCHFVTRQCNKNTKQQYEIVLFCCFIIMTLYSPVILPIFMITFSRMVNDKQLYIMLLLKKDGVIRSSISKNKQCISHKKKDKMTNNDLRNATLKKLKTEQHEPQSNSG